MSNNTEAQAPSAGLDLLKWIVSFLILGGSIWAYQYYSEYSQLARFGGFIVAAILSFALALTTSKGQAMKVFSYEANIERKKVVWPTSKETHTTTAIVAVMVVIIGFLLYMIDGGLSWIVDLILR
jgi:preprotein translocase subunit SecE